MLDVKNHVLHLYTAHKTLVRVRLCTSGVYLYCRAAKCVSQMYSCNYTLQHIYEYVSWQQGRTWGWALAFPLPLAVPWHVFGSWQSVLSREHQRHSLGNKMALDPSNHDHRLLRSSCGIWPQKQRMNSSLFYLTRCRFSASFTDACIGLLFFVLWKIFQLSQRRVISQ